MTSLELVDFINELRRQQGETVVLRHDSFLAKVQKVLGEAAPKFFGTVKRPQPAGGEREYPCYIFPKREATLMAMSYSHEVSAQVYDKMEALEKQVRGQSQHQVPQTLRQALLFAAEQQEVIERQQLALTLAQPKVEFVDRFVDREDTYTATAIGKKLNVSAQTLNKWLVQKGALFVTRKHFSQWYLEKGYGVEKYGESANGHVYQSVYHTPAGAEWILSNFKIQDVRMK
jgi:phage antirepressor YoqD-like protein